MSFTFLTGLSAFIMCWYWQLDGAEVYDKSYCWNHLCNPVHIIFGGLHLVRSLAIYAYLGNDPVITFETYLWVNLCAHAAMAKKLKYTFYDHPDMSESITQFMVCNYPSNS